MLLNDTYEAVFTADLYCNAFSKGIDKPFIFKGTKALERN